MCADVGQTPAHCDDRRLDQVTRALCGCWVMRLPESHVIGLTCAIMAGDEACAEHEAPFSTEGR